MKPEVWTKEETETKLRALKDVGWIRGVAPGNDANVGRTAEEWMGLPESNLPIANGGEWELKGSASTSAPTTLLHMSPSPRSSKVNINRMLLECYGWPHDKAGKKYPETERSFRQTLRYGSFTYRGFSVGGEEGRIFVLFDHNSITCPGYREEVESRIGLGPLSPQPYWAINEVVSRLKVKMGNCCYFLLADKRGRGELTEFRYQKAFRLRNLDTNKFLEEFFAGRVLIDFDTRTGHDHGVKIRMKDEDLFSVYSDRHQIF